MNVEVLVINGCPHARAAVELVATALERSGQRDVRVTMTVVTEENVVEMIGFHGSPTFLIDGVDPFPAVEPATQLSCRVYQTSRGLRGLPDLQDLLESGQFA